MNAGGVDKACKSNVCLTLFDTITLTSKHVNILAKIQIIQMLKC